MFCILVTGDERLAERARHYAVASRMTLIVSHDRRTLMSVLESVVPDLVVVDARQPLRVDVLLSSMPRDIRVTPVIGAESAILALQNAENGI